MDTLNVKLYIYNMLGYLVIFIFVSTLGSFPNEDDDGFYEYNFG